MSARVVAHESVGPAALFERIGSCASSMSTSATKPEVSATMRKATGDDALPQHLPHKERYA